jgi:hypothetical protein
MLVHERGVGSRGRGGARALDENPRLRFLNRELQLLIKLIHVFTYFLVSALVCKRHCTQLVNFHVLPRELEIWRATRRHGCRRILYEVVIKLV